MSRLPTEISAQLAEEIALAGGREVSFVAEVGPDGVITAVRTVARGTVDEVLALPGVAQRGEMLLHNHPAGVLEPSQADLSVAVELHNAGVGFGIIDNSATSLYVVVEVPHAESYQKLDAVSVAGLLAADGPVGRALEQYEDRQSQRDMAAYTTDAYNEGGVALLEAGTGVGKSFAYLVPAIEWAKLNGERTIVSTNTINLQEQLVGKDLPLLARALAEGETVPKYTLLKGWRNYLCLARLETAQSGQSSLLEDERQSELEQIAAWAEQTNDGSLADLTEQPSGELWDEVSAEADLCTRLECPHFNSCFFFNARRRAAEADVLVVNHHLLTADIAVRRAQENWQDAAVLPPYRRLIIDEAHHLEDTAANHLGTQVTSINVARLLSRMERNGRGLIPALVTELRNQDDLLSSASVDLLTKALLPGVTDARRYSTELFGLLSSLLEQVNTQVLRVDDSFTTHKIWQAGLDVALDNLVSALLRLKDGVETVADRLELDQETDQRSKLIGELRGVIRRLQAVMDGTLLTLRPAPGASSVRWLERRGSRPTGGLPFPIGLVTVPLDLAPILRETLFDRVDTVVLTSATLAAGGEFDFLKERIGLSSPPQRVSVEVALPSPFNYAEQCLLCVPRDLPDPRRDERGHDEMLTRAIVEIAHASDGGMFALFTSHAALKRVAQAVRGAVGARWPLLVQGEGQRDHLLRRFRDAGSAILMGTDSFWEGVDVPGKPLRVLVIAKLPFKAPTEPLTAARLELLQEQGEDGFMRYQVPQAALKLKQGFGRLIRSRSDLGVVVIMDHRIASRPYGRVLLESLPPAVRVVGSWQEVRSSIDDFFARHGIGAPT